MFCNGPEHHINRRKLLFGGAKAAAFLTAARRGDADTQAVTAQTRGTAKVCVFVTMNGAPSQLDTFDAKDGPWNPPEADIQQYSGGMLLSRTSFPELSKLTNDLVFLHNVQSWEAAHERAQFYLQTSHPSNPAFIQESPHIGAVVAREMGAPCDVGSGDCTKGWKVLSLL